MTMDAKRYLEEKKKHHDVKYLQRLHGEFLYSYCRRHGIRKFKLKNLKVGYYAKLSQIIKCGEARKGIVYLKRKGLVEEEGVGWRFKFEKTKKV